MTDNTVTLVLLSGLLLGTWAGYVMHRSDFCIAGMFRDIFLFKSMFKLRILLLLVATGMLLFELSRLSGLLPLYPFPLIGSPSLANLIGGFLFGIGMVLAGGCVVGTLYKMGSGSIPALVAFIGLIIGSAIYAEYHPWWSSVIRKTTFWPGTVTVPQLLGITPVLPVILLAILSGWYFYRVHKMGGWVRTTFAEGALQQWQAAVLLALIGTLSYVTVGLPLGITTAYAKIAGYCESIVFSEHFGQLAYFRSVPLSYRHPLTGSSLIGGPGPAIDAIAVIQLPVIVGIVCGSAASAWMLNELKIYAKMPLRHYICAFIGGIIMGLASRMAPACNVWHLLGGLPILALQSILFVAGIIPGTWLGTLFLKKLVIR
ncbi:YeeE/YedE family protein [Geobacter sp. OR-1]|uniref:YeeE/YedE family protein n=1 Tax=Geobacter sp. OR-1 TaxID=1266765 RepID=UPI001269A9B9|nr:YeeE/YedE family protein [Geobacter sp. OR-1]